MDMLDSIRRSPTIGILQESTGRNSPSSLVMARVKTTQEQQLSIRITLSFHLKKLLEEESQKLQEGLYVGYRTENLHYAIQGTCVSQ